MVWELSERNKYSVVMMKERERSEENENEEKALSDIVEYKYTFCLYMLWVYVR